MKNCYYEKGMSNNVTNVVKELEYVCLNRKFLKYYEYQKYYRLDGEHIKNFEFL